ncbi:hypothetical protein AAF712_012514 [Marasmius tenuissimus]|uniref:Uncharacterized protein n=1 Tax=Marasmius tenuissimus TaxID=585030 RepID=A0ABR2ZI93_9AGAR
MPRTPRPAISKRALRKSRPRVQLILNPDFNITTRAQLKKGQRKSPNITSVHDGRLCKIPYPLENRQMMSAKGTRFLLAPCMRCLHCDPVSHFEVPVPKDTTKKASVWAGKQIAVCVKGKEHGCGFFVCFDTIRDRGPLVVKTNGYSLSPGGVHADDDVMVQDGLIHYDPSGRFAHIEMSDADADGDNDPDYQAPAPVSEPAKPVATSSSDSEVIDLTKARDYKFCHCLKVPGVHHACKVSNQSTINIDECPDCDICSSIELPNMVHVCYIRDD